MDNAGLPVVLTNPWAISTSAPNWPDRREEQYVDQIMIDVSALTAADIGNGIVYVSIEETPETNLHRGVLLVNCSSLPGPVSFCSDNAIYIRGDYNTVNWQPSAVMADAVNLLSNHFIPPVGHPYSASSTTYYVAILAGDTPNAAAYNGGLENFPRFLEYWGGATCTIYGSFINLFLSENAVGQWGKPDVYSPPVRDWHFDVRFLDFNQLPPGTPSVGSVIRIAFRQEFMG